MEHFEIKIDHGRWEIMGIPDAHAVVKLKKDIAKHLTDLALHRHDLILSKESLSFIEKNQLSLDYTIIDSLWRSAIVHYVKCFTDQITEYVNNKKIVPEHARAKLDKEKIYNEPLAIDAFKNILSLRNKHIVHDENAYLQSLPGFVINDGKKNYSVEKVFCLTAANVTVDGNFNNLSLLVNQALEFVEAAFTNECQKISEKLEKSRYEDLIKMGDLQLTIANINALKKTRKLE